MPHQSTIRKWYQGYDCTPGFSTDALLSLQLLAQDAKAKNEKLYGSLIMDEMKIREQLVFDKSTKTNVGCEDYGNIKSVQPRLLADGNKRLAKEALVFMINIVNRRSKIPVAYFLSAGMSGLEKANIVTELLQFLQDSIIIVNFVFDGAQSNVSMTTHLGINLSLTNMVPYFLHPITNHKVFVMFDPVHDLKLVRNTFASKGFILNKNGEKASWDHIKALEKLQSENGLHLANKLRFRHINFYKQKMKVSLAAQTLSESVAKSLEFCKNNSTKSDYKEFQNCDATISLVRNINIVFDILNSKSTMGKGFKKPLRPTTKELFFDEFDRITNYLMELKFENGQLIVKSQNQRGFVGLILAMKSFRGIYENYVENGELKYLLGYKLNQDHLETFFSVVRTRGGFNDNPNAYEFKSAYKRILVKTEIKATNSGNCLIIDDTSILNITSTQEKNKITNFLQNVDTSGDGDEYDFIDIDLNDYVQDVVTYIAGYVQKRLVNKIKCDECRESIYESANESCSLIDVKNFGGLVKPSKIIKQICLQREKSFRIHDDLINKNDIMDKLIRSAFRHLDLNIFCTMNDHFLDSDPIENHRLIFVKVVLHEYFIIRIHHKNMCLQEQHQKTKVRNFYKKMVHFKGQ